MKSVVACDQRSWQVLFTSLIRTKTSLQNEIKKTTLDQLQATITNVWSGKQGKALTCLFNHDLIMRTPIGPRISPFNCPKNVFWKSDLSRVLVMHVNDISWMTPLKSIFVGSGCGGPIKSLYSFVCLKWIFLRNSTLYYSVRTMNWEVYLARFNCTDISIKIKLIIK